MKRPLASALVLATHLVAGALDAQNLLDNGEFDLPDGLSGWQISVGSVALVEDSGSCPSSDALLGTSSVSGGGLQGFMLISQQCLPLDGSSQGEISLGAMFRTTAAVWARLDLAYFESESCVGSSSFSPSVFGSTSATWQRISGTVPVAETVRSIQLIVSAVPMTTAVPQFTVEWDRLFVGVEPELLVDGFEVDGGTTCRWSATTGTP